MMEVPLVEFRRHLVSVEVPTPKEDWLTRLTSRGDGCGECGGELPDPPIYLNTEGPEGDNTGAESLCSWGCLLELAAAVVVVGDETVGSLVSIKEVPDWRADV